MPAKARAKAKVKVKDTKLGQRLALVPQNPG
jgi:hypothetical protein